MADLRHLLAIYVHAHRAGNAVPPHIDADARAALAAEPPTPAPAGDGEREELADRLGWIAAQLSDIGWGDDSASVARAAALLRQPAPAPAADGEREELAALIEQTADSHNGLWPGPIIGKLYRAAALLRQPAPAAARPAPTPDDFRRWWRETGSDDSGPTPEMLLTANAWAEAWAAMRQPAPAPVPVPVSERPQERQSWCDMQGRCWLAGLPHWAIPQPPQGGEVEE